MVFAALFHKEQKKKYRVLSNFSTTVSYVICNIRVYTCTAPSALLGKVASSKTICCTCKLLCKSQQQLSWRQTHVKPTTVIQSLLAARLGQVRYIFLSRAI